ncbi:hypothetical protein GMOD_00005712 [Pyrenophora seminiperda CCB06]|uniref:Uncharacterized protein n=1 Tax=Pyrenophora seminiperda CCB06 TaxID=1302712 RepID=A0A3M7M9Q6_9PLEO|nr:hypothetical protein GMOD_00005712 [Pyrenophora seminiperda CCB06]
MRFTNTLISSVSTLALVSSALPIGETHIEEHSVMEPYVDFVTEPSSVTKIPGTPAYGSQAGEHAEGINPSDPFKLREHGTFEDKTIQDPSGLAGDLRHFPNVAIPKPSKTQPLYVGQEAGGLQEEEEEEEGSDGLGGFSDVLSPFEDALAKRAELPILGSNKGALSAESDGVKQSSNALSNSALPGDIQGTLHKGGPDLSGLTSPLYDGEVLTGKAKKRQETGTETVPDWAWPSWPAWPSPTPGKQNSMSVGTKVAEDGLLGMLTGQKGDVQESDDDATTTTPTTPGFLRGVLGESRSRTTAKRREAVQAVLSSRTPLQFPGVDLVLPTKQGIKKLPQELPWMRKEALEDGAAPELSRRQVGDLSMGKAENAVIQKALAVMGVSNGAARRSEDALVEKRGTLNAPNPFQGSRNGATMDKALSAVEFEFGAVTKRQVSNEQAQAAGIFAGIVEEMAKNAVGQSPHTKLLAAAEEGEVLSKRLELEEALKLVNSFRRRSSDDDDESDDEDDEVVSKPHSEADAAFSAILKATAKDALRETRTGGLPANKNDNIFSKRQNDDETDDESDAVVPKPHPEADAAFSAILKATAKDALRETRTGGLPANKNDNIFSKRQKVPGFIQKAGSDAANDMVPKFLDIIPTKRARDVVATPQQETPAAKDLTNLGGQTVAVGSQTVAVGSQAVAGVV